MPNAIATIAVDKYPNQIVFPVTTCAYSTVMGARLAFRRTLVDCRLLSVRKTGMSHRLLDATLDKTSPFSAPFKASGYT